MSDQRKYIQAQKFQLAGSGISATDTSITLRSFTTPDGTTIAMTDIGTLGTGTLGPATSREEVITFTGVTQNGDGTATLTGVTRGCEFRAPYTQNTALRKSHSGNETFILTNTGQFYDSFANKENDETINGAYTFTQVPVTTGGDAVTAGGLVRLAQLQAAVLGSLTNMSIVSPGTAGETIAAGNLIYFKAADARWWKCDADTAATVDNILMAIAQGAGTAGNAITDGVLLFGMDTNQTGLSAGSTYYAGNTAGAIVSTPGTVEVTIGQANTTTDLYFSPRYNQQLTEDQQDALGGTSGTPSATNKFVTADDVSSAGASGKIVRATGTSLPAMDGSLLTGIKPSIASGENLTAGNPVYINPIDSTLYKAHGFKELDSTSIALTSSTTLKTSKLSDTQLLTLTHSGATLTVAVYDINSGASVATQTVTTAFDTTSISTTLTGATACRLSDTTFIVLYVKTTDSALYFRTGTISGGTITMDTETAYTGSPTYCFGLDSQPGASDGKVVFAYTDGTTDPNSNNTAWNYVLAYLTCSTNTATVTYSSTYSTSSGGAYFQSPVWSVAQFTRGIAYGLFCFVDGGGTRGIAYNYIDTVAGTTSNGNFSFDLENETGSGISSTYSQYRPYVVGHNGSIYYGWAVYGSTDSVQNVKTVLASSPSGTKIVYQSTTTRLAGDTTSSALPMFGNEMGVIVTGLNNAETTSRLYGSIYIQKDKIYGFYSKTTLGITNTPQFSAWYSNLKDEIVVVYYDASGTVKQWRLPTLFSGYAVSTVTAPAASNLSEFVTTSGLTANAKYYLKDTYTSIGDITTSGTIPIGQALSTTVIIKE